MQSGWLIIRVSIFFQKTAAAHRRPTKNEKRPTAMGGADRPLSDIACQTS
jgi:hypothetical protein